MYRRLGSRTAGEDQELGALAWKTGSGVSSGRRPVAIATCTYGGPAAGTDHRAGLTGYLALAPPPETAPVARVLSVRIDLPELLDAGCGAAGGLRGVLRRCPSLRVTSVDWPRLERSAGSESCHRRWRGVACAVVDPRSSVWCSAMTSTGCGCCLHAAWVACAPERGIDRAAPRRDYSGAALAKRRGPLPSFPARADQANARDRRRSGPSSTDSVRAAIRGVLGCSYSSGAGRRCCRVSGASCAFRPAGAAAAPRPPAWRDLLNTSAERP